MSYENSVMFKQVYAKPFNWVLQPGTSPHLLVRLKCRLLNPLYVIRGGRKHLDWVAQPAGTGFPLRELRLPNRIQDRRGSATRGRRCHSQVAEPHYENCSSTASGKRHKRHRYYSISHSISTGFVLCVASWETLHRYQRMKLDNVLYTWVNCQRDVSIS